MDAGENEEEEEEEGSTRENELRFLCQGGVRSYSLACVSVEPRLVWFLLRDVLCALKLCGRFACSMCGNVMIGICCLCVAFVP